MGVDLTFCFVASSSELFDGSTDLSKHVLRYHNLMVPFGMLKENREATMLKMFANSLKEPTLTWYYSLTLGFVDSFSNLSNKF